MFARYLLLATALVASVAIANEDFAFEGMPKKPYFYTGDANPKTCFDNSAIKTIPSFTYGTGEVTTQQNENDGLVGGGQSQTTIPGQAARNCGAGSSGRTELYGDRMWVIDRDYVGHCISFLNNNKTAAAQALDANAVPVVNAMDWSNIKPATNNPFNQNYKFAITRKLWACRYDSQVETLNTDLGSGSTSGLSSLQVTAAELKLKNDRANASPSTVRIAYKAEEWKIYSSNWNSDLTHLQTVAAGSYDGNVVWTNPTNAGMGNSAKQPFLDTCGAKSGATCKPTLRNSYANDSTSVCNLVSNSAYTNAACDTVAEITNNPVCYNTANSQTVEKIACATSVQLLARSKGYTPPAAGYVPSNDDILSQLGLWEDMFGGDEAFPAPTGSQTNQGLITHGIVGRLLLASHYQPAISAFGGRGVNDATFQQSKTFYLNNQRLLEVQFQNANNDPYQRQFAAGPSADCTNKVKVLSTPGGTANDISLASVGYAAPTGTSIASKQLFKANDGNFAGTGFGTGSSNLRVGNHYWATVETTYNYRNQWFCQNIGGNDPNAITGWPFRYTCDKTYSGWTTTPGQIYNTDENNYPTVERQFPYTGTTPTGVTDRAFTYGMQDATYTFKSDPVFVGFLNSLTQAAYQMAAADIASNGDTDDGRLSQDARDTLTAKGAENEGKGMLLIGAGVVVLGVLGSVALCISAGVHGKLSGSK